MLLAANVGDAINTLANGGDHHVMKWYTVYSLPRAGKPARVSLGNHAGVANGGTDNKKAVADAADNTREGSYQGAFGAR